MAQVIENVSFPDFDLDATDLGGVLAWSEPTDISQATSSEGGGNLINFMRVRVECGLKSATTSS